LTVDEFVLGIMVSIFPITTKPITKFNYAQFLADQIHYQLSEFESLRSFRYQSYLVHLFLFTQAFHFMHLGIKVEDDLGNPTSVTHWTSVIMKKPLNVEFSQYVDQFMSKSYQIIHNQVPPRIFPECKKLLQLSPDKRVGDWYIFEHYTEIRVYGCQLSPFRLPVFMTPRIFSLEYVRKRLNSDEIHFVPNKYKVTFKLKKEVGPFIVNTRSTLQVTTKILSALGLQQGEPWNYDPHGIISSKIISHGKSPYQHQQKEQLELLENQDSWKDVHEHSTDPW
jgi:hypothetical protein